MVDGRWCQLWDQFLSYMKLKIAVPRNTYWGLFPESANRPIQVVAMFLIMSYVVDPFKCHLLGDLSFSNISHIITSQASHWIYFHKGWPKQWINELISNGGDCRTAPATQGLLTMFIESSSQHNHYYYLNNSRRSNALCRKHVLAKLRYITTLNLKSITLKYW